VAGWYATLIHGPKFKDFHQGDSGLLNLFKINGDSSRIEMLTSIMLLVFRKVEVNTLTEMSFLYENFYLGQYPSHSKG
jgi:hypothetical protein